MKKLLVSVLLITLIIGVGLRIWYVNAYPDPQFVPPKDEKYQIGEWVPLDGAFQYSASEDTEGYYVKLEDIVFVTPEEYIEKYGLESDVFAIGPHGEEPEYVADITLNFRNEDNEEGYILFLYYRIYSEVDLASFVPYDRVNFLLHPEMSDKLGFRVFPGTETGPSQFCLISSVEMNGAISGSLDNFPKHLQVSTTPERKVIEIPSN